MTVANLDLAVVLRNWFRSRFPQASEMAFADITIAMRSATIGSLFLALREDVSGIYNGSAGSR